MPIFDELPSNPKLFRSNKKTNSIMEKLNQNIVSRNDNTQNIIN